MNCGLLLWIGGAKLKDTLNTLSRMEFHRYPVEPTPVGGEGAGVLYLRGGEFRLVKVAGSEKPSGTLAEKIDSLEFCSPIILGHVRRASKDFKASAPYSWGAQPYSCSCKGFRVFSIHNGFVKNYRELYSASHVYESYHPELLREPHIIDSEVIPHFCADLIEEYGARQGFKKLFEAIKGNSTWIILAVKNGLYIGIFHKGKTRGLNIYQGENKLIAVTRAEALKTPPGLKKIVEIGYREEAELLLIYKVEIKDQAKVNFLRIS